MMYSISNMPQSPMNLPRELMVVMFFAWRNNFIGKSIGDYTTDRLTYKIKITDDIFFDDMISFVIPSVIVFSTESMFKHRRNILLVIINFLVV